MTGSNRSTVKSVETNFEIIHALSEMNGGRISDIADRLDIPLSTAHDHLNTLERLDYVTRIDGDYHPGIRFLTLGGRVRCGYRLYQVAKPEIDRLADETGEHANLMVEEHGKGTFIYRATGQQAVHLDTYTGMRVHLHTTALGKAILSHLPRNRVETIVEEHGLPTVGRNTIGDETALFEELETIDERGYATDVEERIEGISCVAAPILDADEDVLGAVSVSGPSRKFGGSYLQDDLLDRVRRTANVIEVNLEFS